MERGGHVTEDAEFLLTLKGCQMQPSVRGQRIHMGFNADIEIVSFSQTVLNFGIHLGCDVELTQQILQDIQPAHRSEIRDDRAVRVAPG